jgi:hypothetical protein
MYKHTVVLYPEGARGKTVQTNIIKSNLMAVFFCNFKLFEIKKLIFVNHL